MNKIVLKNVSNYEGFYLLDQLRLFFKCFGNFHYLEVCGRFRRGGEEGDG